MSFICTFPNTIPFISLTFLIMLAETFNATLNRSGDSEDPSLVSDGKGKAFNVSLLV